MNGLERKVIKQGVISLINECNGCGLKGRCDRGYVCSKLEKALDKIGARINGGGI